MPSNLSYFEKRTANNVWRTYNNLEKDVRQLIQMYDVASKEVAAELYKIAEKLERDGVISRSEFYRGRHLQQLSAAYKQTLQDLGARVEDLGEQAMLRGAEELYGEFSELIGMPINYDRTALMRLTQEQWHGANFSQRIWKNQEKLLNELRTTISSGIRTGKTITQIAIGLHNKMQSGLNNAFRLVRTETMHHLNEANKRAMIESGVVEKVKEVVTLDERTSDQCAPHQGKIHDIDKAPTLPRHPNCRCALAAVIDVEALAKKFDEEEAEL